MVLRLDAVQPATKVGRAAPIQQGVDARMRLVPSAEHRGRLLGLVRGPNVPDFHGREQYPLRIPERDGIARADGLGESGVDIERDRNRPQQARRQAHIFEDTRVLLPGIETLERRKRAVQDQLKIAQLAPVQVPGLELQRRALGLVDGRFVEKEVFENAAVRLLEGTHDRNEAPARPARDSPGCLRRKS
jgi:hypothetical protein